MTFDLTVYPCSWGRRPLRLTVRSHSCHGSSRRHMTPAEGSASRPEIERCVSGTGSAPLGTGSASLGDRLRPPGTHEDTTAGRPATVSLDSRGVDFSQGREELLASSECVEASGLLADWLMTGASLRTRVSLMSLAHLFTSGDVQRNVSVSHTRTHTRTQPWGR